LLRKEEGGGSCYLYPEELAVWDATQVNGDALKDVVLGGGPRWLRKPRPPVVLRLKAGAPPYRRLLMW